ncbi:MAG TPA: tRNA dihydrouridine(20/20a) synthase DusA [Alphaproteobacteria bacterium]|nr:tRNA dihydrouridine(20/20a) synthase DusA [Alphaproteobacteria bacterium]
MTRTQDQSQPQNQHIGETWRPDPLGDRRLSVAPMMDWTDRHCRAFHRLLSQETLLYTEMVTTGALLHGDVPRHLDFDAAEHPVALQLGGSEPADMAASARLGERWGYDEINMNVGCPSDRVQRGTFGACLMAEPVLVAANVAAMRDAVSIPVTVKCRIGIDDQDSEAALTDFVGQVSEKGGCSRFIIHARKAWLQGLSPKENRDIPPLDYGRVSRLKQQFPHLHVGINGGVLDLDTARVLLRERPEPESVGESEGDRLGLGPLDSVMIGRAAYQNPWLLAEADALIFGQLAASAPESRHAVIEAFLPYLEAQCARGVPLHAMTRHILGLFNGQPGARLWRRYISENAPSRTAGPEVVRQALAFVSGDACSESEATRAG